MDWNRLENESDFEWKKRLCIAKINKECDMDWCEIVSLLGLDISADHLRKTAYGIYEYDEYLHGHNGIAKKILSISDLHIPFQLPITTFEEYKGRIDVLQINGDVLDCQSLSKFSKMYRISPMEEIIEARQYLIDLIEYIGANEVYINYGNHDIRMGKYFAKNLDTDILELMPNNAIELIVQDGFRHYNKRTRQNVYYPPIKDTFEEDGISIHYVDDWKTKIGKTWFVHPLAYRQGILSTTEKAKQYLQDVDSEPFDTVVMAHTHKVGQTKIGRMHLFEQGACCYVDKMNYMDGRLQKPQNEGFIFVAQDKDGNLIEDKTKIISIN